MKYKDYKTDNIINFLEEQISLVKEIDEELKKGEDYIFENRKMILYRVNMLGKYINLTPIYDSSKARKLPTLKELADSKVEKLDPKENLLNDINIDGKKTSWYDILYRGLKKELDVINNNISTSQLDDSKETVSLTFHKNNAEIDFLLSLDNNTVELLHFSDVEDIKQEYIKFNKLNKKYSDYKTNKTIENIEKALNSRTPQTFAKYAETELNFIDLVSIELSAKKSLNPKHIEKVEEKGIQHIEIIKNLEKELLETKDNILRLRENIKSSMEDITDKFSSLGFELIDDFVYEDLYNKDLTLKLDVKKTINKNIGSVEDIEDNSDKNNSEEVSEDKEA